MPLHTDYTVAMYPISVRFHDAAVADRLKAEASTQAAPPPPSPRNSSTRACACGAIP